MSYYQFGREEILQKAKDRYSQEKSAEYYLKNNEAIKSLSKEGKDKIKKYQTEMKYYSRSEFYLTKYKMSLKFDEIKIDKKEFHKSKKPTVLNLVDTNKIVISDKFNQTDDGFKYFIGYQEDNIIRPLCIILPQMSGYIKYFKNGGKNMSFITKDDSVLFKYNEIGNKIKMTLSIKFHSNPIYDEKYIKAKIREFNGVTKTNFLSNEVPKEGVHYICIASISIDSVI